MTLVTWFARVVYEAGGVRVVACREVERSPDGGIISLGDVELKTEILEADAMGTPRWMPRADQGQGERAAAIHLAILAFPELLTGEDPELVADEVGRMDEVSS